MDLECCVAAGQDLEKEKIFRFCRDKQLEMSGCLVTDDPDVFPQTLAEVQHLASVAAHNLNIYPVTQ